MNEKGISVLESYDFTVIKTSRVRGAVLCETDSGVVLLKEYTGTPGRLAFQEQLLEFISKSGVRNVDCIMRNKDNELCTYDTDGTGYVVKKWFKGRECDVMSYIDIMDGARELAKIHNVMKHTPLCEMGICREFPGDSLAETYDRHNREMKKIRTFMRRLKQKSEFEISVLNCYQTFYEQGLSAKNMLVDSGYKEMKETAAQNCTIIHGDYNYHNIFFVEEGTAATGFDRACINVQVTDLYTYLRKVMEKHQWNVKTGSNVLNEYSKIRDLTRDEVNLLKIMLSYPEKFWKILNFYYNSSKSWVSARNMEKLNMVRMQDGLKNKFIREIFK